MRSPTAGTVDDYLQRHNLPEFSRAGDAAIWFLASYWWDKNTLSPFTQPSLAKFEKTSSGRRNMKKSDGFTFFVSRRAGIWPVKWSNCDLSGHMFRVVDIIIETLPQSPWLSP